MERRLAAILSYDAVGYSRAMGVDEGGTLERLKAHRRKVIDPKAAQYGGRTIKLMGDGALMEFASVVDAVAFAVGMQFATAEHDAQLPESQRLLYRIGINVGDVIVEGDDIYGDGVNVAARLEGLAEAGGICVRRNVRNQVRGKLDVDFEDLGEVEVRNIERPVRAFHVVMNDKAAALAAAPSDRAPKPTAFSRIWQAAAGVALTLALLAGLAWWQPWGPEFEPASVDDMAYPLPDKPSIAVLPFDNLSDDPTQKYLADGMTENLVTALSKVSEMFVIARNSIFTYKDTPVTVQQVARELGVRHVLQGTVQRSGDKVRITTQLIDAITGRYLWSERYDQDVNDFFALQDEITLNVVTALQVELTEGEQARVRRRGTDVLEALLLVTQGVNHRRRFTKEDNVRAKELLRESIELDPNYVEAYIELARVHLLDFQAGWAESRGESFKRCVELVREALKLEDSHPEIYDILGTIHLYLREYDRAIAFGEKAVALNPNSAGYIASLAFTLNYSGQPENALVLLQKAMRLSPYYPDWYLGELGRAYYLMGQYEDAIEALKQRLQRNPNSGEAQVLLAAAYGASGQEKESRAALAEFLEPRPYYTLRHYAQGEYYKKAEDLRQVLADLRKAGMPE